jgi:hypothetical protein
MTTDTTTTVQSLNSLIERLTSLNKVDKLSFRKIARLPEFSGVPFGTLANVAKGRDPKDTHTRALLGLPAIAHVVPVQGAVPDGTQVIGASMCIICSKWYVSNSPRRKKCYECSPCRKETK